MADVKQEVASLFQALVNTLYIFSSQLLFLITYTLQAYFFDGLNTLSVSRRYYFYLFNPFVCLSGIVGVLKETSAYPGTAPGLMM